MVNLRLKKKTPGWLVATRKGGTTLQDPIRYALRHLTGSFVCHSRGGFGRLGVKVSMVYNHGTFVFRTLVRRASLWQDAQLLLKIRDGTPELGSGNNGKGERERGFA